MTSGTEAASMQLDRIYRYRFDGIDQSSRTAVWSAIAPYIHQMTGEPSRVLDPAAGLGEFIAGCPAPERWAVDQVDMGLTEIPGLKTQIASITDAELPSEYFDLIFVSNLLEHLESPEAVADTLQRFHGLLRPGGMICVMGPNFRYCAREYFDCADHILPLTHVSVAEHLYGAGFEVVDVTKRFLPYSFRSVLPASAALTRLYLRARPAWRLLGKQFLVTGRVA